MVRMSASRKGKNSRVLLQNGAESGEIEIEDMKKGYPGDILFLLIRE
jgi:hypothetical protein